MAQVLFIEDNPEWQTVLERLLRTAGHSMERAVDVESAMGLLGRNVRFDSIVFDLILGDATNDPFLWFDALIKGMEEREIDSPPIIVVTGLDMEKEQVVQLFTEYRNYVVGYHEKAKLDQRKFLENLKKGKSISFSPTRDISVWRYLGYALLTLIIFVLIIGFLLWSVNQISDPETQQIFLQMGAGLMIAIMVTIIILSQNAKIENVLDSISKIWKG